MSTPAAKKLRVFLADDHAVVRAGLKLLISAQSDMEVIGEAGDGSTAVHEARTLLPDVVVMDVSMPELNGVQATERLKNVCPDIKIVVLSAYSDAAHVRQLLASGASSYVLKRTASEELIRAIRTVAQGGVYLDPAVAGAVVMGYARPAEVKDASTLSPREYEVLLDVVHGYTNKEIADRLHLSVKTVEGHKTRIMEKLDLRSRAELVRYALRQGWLQDE
jgi:two-component system response regulator NreC